MEMESEVRKSGYGKSTGDGSGDMDWGVPWHGCKEGEGPKWPLD